MNTKTRKNLLGQTTQYARMLNGTILKKHYKSPFPSLNLKRCNLATDTVYSNTPAIDGGETCAWVFLGTDTLVTDVYGMKMLMGFIYGMKMTMGFFAALKQFVNTLEDTICECVVMSQLLSGRAQVELSTRCWHFTRTAYWPVQSLFR
jgi:hypothetical protein